MTMTPEQVETILKRAKTASEIRAGHEQHLHGKIGYLETAWKKYCRVTTPAAKNAAWEKVTQYALVVLTDLK